MPKTILVNDSEDEFRVALLENKQLSLVYLSVKSDQELKGNVYCGVVTNIDKRSRHISVKYGAEQYGILNISEVNKKFLNNTSSEIAVAATKSPFLKIGQPLLIQVVKHDLIAKGLVFSSFLSLAGQYVVFYPHADFKCAISKKIQNPEDKKRLLDMYNQLDPADYSIKFRTIAVNCTINEIKTELAALQKIFEKILSNFKSSKQPGLIYQDQAEYFRMFNNLKAKDKIYADSSEIFYKLQQWIENVFSSDFKARPSIYFYRAKKPLFYKFRIENNIQSINNRQVRLNQQVSLNVEKGDYITIIQVVALNLLDTKEINKKDDILSLKLNLEALNEIKKQIQLRDLGGIILIQFIDLASPESMKILQERFHASFKSDLSISYLSNLSEFSVIKVKRYSLFSQKIKLEIEDSAKVFLESDNLASLTKSAGAVLRKIKNFAQSKEITSVNCLLAGDLADFLLNKKRHQLAKIEEDFSISIVIRGDLSLNYYHPDQIYVH